MNIEKQYIDGPKMQQLCGKAFQKPRNHLAVLRLPKLQSQLLSGTILSQLVEVMR